MNTSLNYNICFDNDLTQLISYCNEQSSEIIVGTDSNTYKYCYPKLNPSFQAQIKHIIQIPAGDQNKNVEQVYHVYSELSKVNSRRNTLLLILGGGMCGDLFGYAASTYKRGIPFVHVPTSLLAMVDSSVGSKNGVNFQSYKNLIGTFTDPKAVFIHSPFLQTLPLRETISAFAECYKHAILDSPQHLELIRLKTKNGYDADNELISTSISYKSKIVVQDKHEAGLRKVLNFGHTIGHAIESLSLNSASPLLHGEAVAAGMIAELYLAKTKCGFNPDVCSELSHEIKKTIPFQLPNKQMDKLLDYISQDKKNTSEKYAFSLPESIGKCQIDVTCSEEEVIEALSFLYNEL